jgi:hypothetical protein
MFRTQFSNSNLDAGIGSDHPLVLYNETKVVSTSVVKCPFQGRKQYNLIYFWQEFPLKIGVSPDARTRP